MRNYYRLTLGKGNMHAQSCFADNCIAIGFLHHIDLTGKLPDEWREFNKEYIPVFLKEIMAVGKPERATQNRLNYRYLGDWTDRAGNSNIEEGLLNAWLTGCGYSIAQINAPVQTAHRSRQP
jgi:hypothetical protein